MRWQNKPHVQLPPHGSWKPSINLSSCLTSLQVLMSEPNPDDPLMPEMAEELRYNRDKVEMLSLSAPICPLQLLHLLIIQFLKLKQNNKQRPLSSLTPLPRSGQKNMRSKKRKMDSRILRG